MKIYRISQHIYHYYINCVSSDGESIGDMVDNAREIGYNTFVKGIDIEELKELFPFYNWGNRKENGLKLKDDYAVSYYKSIYEGRPCLYVAHSAIEYVFI